jgi:hypothetical protein
MIQKLRSSFEAAAPANKKVTKDEEMAKSDDDEEDDEEGEVSFDERIKFTDSVRKLTIKQMTSLVKMIQDE